jgi:hypothetical protein
VDAGSCHQSTVAGPIHVSQDGCREPPTSSAQFKGSLVIEQLYYLCTQLSPPSDPDGLRGIESTDTGAGEAFEKAEKKWSVPSSPISAITLRCSICAT